MYATSDSGRRATLRRREGVPMRSGDVHQPYATFLRAQKALRTVTHSFVKTSRTVQYEARDGQLAMRSELAGLEARLEELDESEMAVEGGGKAAELAEAIATLRARVSKVAQVLEHGTAMCAAAQKLTSLALEARVLEEHELPLIAKYAEEVRETFTAAGVIKKRGVWPKLYLAIVEFVRFLENNGFLGPGAETMIEVYHKFDNQLEAVYRVVPNVNQRDKYKMERVAARQNLRVITAAEEHHARRARPRQA